jgi:hypothetical protein
MAELGSYQVRSPQLMALLSAQRDVLLSGAHYPDAGYWASGAGIPGGDYGEISHWERFANGYVAHIRDKQARGECGTKGLADPQGPCADLIAHMMGAAAHGITDETWDWLFEPRVTDHGEVPDHPTCHEEHGAVILNAVPPCSLIQNIEYAMDVVAIVDHNRWAKIPAYVPDTAELVQVYERIKREGDPEITEDGIRGGHSLSTAAMTGERLGAAVDSERVRQQMPWASSHYYTEPGGVLWSSRAVAGYMDALWAKLHGTHPAPRLVAQHPAEGATGVPFSWLPPLTSPGPHTGGGEKRVIAVLSSSLAPATVGSETFKLLDPQGVSVSALEGLPRVGPYGGDEGTHSMLFYPAVDLTPCARYTAVATTGIRDHAGAMLPQDARWSFTTRAQGAPGTPCPRPHGPARPAGAPALDRALREPRLHPRGQDHPLPLPGDIPEGRRAPARARGEDPLRSRDRVHEQPRARRDHAALHAPGELPSACPQAGLCDGAHERARRALSAADC